LLRRTIDRLAGWLFFFEGRFKSKFYDRRFVSIPYTKQEGLEVFAPNALTIAKRAADGLSQSLWEYGLVRVGYM